MGIIKTFAGALSGTLADQWIDAYTAGSFDEYTVVTPGVQIVKNNKRGSNTRSSIGVITNGSKIFVPENTAAFIFSQSGIENIIIEPGGYEYRDGQDSIFSGSDFSEAIIDQTMERFGSGGITTDFKSIAFVNLREIRGIKFGTKGPQVYNDLFYGTDLEIRGYGSFSVKVKNPETFVKNFVPANTDCYSFNEPRVISQLTSEFIQSFIVVLNSLSGKYRISQLPARANEISGLIVCDDNNAGTWLERFGFEVEKVAIENIELTDDSRQLVKEYSANKMHIKAYDDVSQRSADIAAQQQIAAGVKNHGLGDGGGAILGMNIAQGVINSNPSININNNNSRSIEEQIELVKNLKGLVDIGVLSEEEFNVKKKEIMGL